MGRKYKYSVALGYQMSVYFIFNDFDFLNCILFPAKTLLSTFLFSFPLIYGLIHPWVIQLHTIYALCTCLAEQTRAALKE